MNITPIDSVPDNWKAKERAMGTYVGTPAQDSERLAAGRAWVRGGMAAAVTGMLAWLA